jgi:hypothetical protein
MTLETMEGWPEPAYSDSRAGRPMSTSNGTGGRVGYVRTTTGLPSANRIAKEIGLRTIEQRKPALAVTPACAAYPAAPAAGRT